MMILKVVERGMSKMIYLNFKPWSPVETSSLKRFKRRNRKQDACGTL